MTIFRKRRRSKLAQVSTYEETVVVSPKKEFRVFYSHGGRKLSEAAERRELVA